MAVQTQLARELTTQEIALYRANGWAHLPGLIPPTLAAEMREESERLLGADGQGEARPGIDWPSSWWNDRHYLARDGVEPFRAVSLSAQMGRNAQLLLERPVDVRWYSDMIACKLPASAGRMGEATMVHQDLGIQFDRIGKTTFWIAMDEIPPERGSMRFYSGSHRLGSIGRHLNDPELDALVEYPWIADEFELSPPLDLQPGDATVHMRALLHSAPENETDEPRWVYQGMFIPAETLFTGAPHSETDGLGLEPNRPFDHPKFPVVYPAP